MYDLSLVLDDSFLKVLDFDLLCEILVEVELAYEIKEELEVEVDKELRVERTGERLGVLLDFSRSGYLAFIAAKDSSIVGNAS